MEPVMPPLPQSPIQRLAARSRTKEDIVAAGESMKRTSLPFLFFFHNMNQPAPHRHASRRFNGNAKKVQSVIWGNQFFNAFRKNSLHILRLIS